MTESMDAMRRAAIRARCEAATDGEWYAEGELPSVGNVFTTLESGDCWLAEAAFPDDARFIAAARADVSDLLAALDQSEAEIGRLRAIAQAGMATAAHAWGKSVASGYREAVRALATICDAGEAAPAGEE